MHKPFYPIWIIQKLIFVINYKHTYTIYIYCLPAKDCEVSYTIKEKDFWHKYDFTPFVLLVFSCFSFRCSLSFTVVTYRKFSSQHYLACYEAIFIVHLWLMSTTLLKLPWEISHCLLWVGVKNMCKFFGGSI